MPSIFTRIIQGEIPSYKIAENERFFAFLDIHPLRRGHTLVIPKMEVDKLFDLPPNTYEELWMFVRQVATAIEKACVCDRVGVAVVGLEVPHAHVHLIPIDEISDMDFSKPKLELSKAEFERIAERIRDEMK